MSTNTLTSKAANQQSSPSLGKGYYESPWPGEDGGPQRLQATIGLNGLAIKPGEQLIKQASRRLCTGNMVVLRNPGEVYIMHVDTLRDKVGIPCSSYIEKVDPHTLQTVKSSGPLPGGIWWPGGFNAHRNGDLYVTFGRYMHRLDADCQLKASLKLPQDLPYNSHVVLDNGFLVTKPIASEGNTQLLIVDPDTLTKVCPAVDMPEPSISRLSAYGNTVYVTGVTTIYRYHFDAETRELTYDNDWSLDYIADSQQDYGWDPVIDDDNIWFIDNGRHRMGRTSLSMLNAGINPTPNNLIRVSQSDCNDFSITPICNKPFGAVTNPPLYCPQRRIVIAYDSANAVVKAWRYNPDNKMLNMLWSKENFGMGGHTIYYPDTGEVVTADYQSLKSWRGLKEGEHSVVLDIETGQEKARLPMGNYMQSCCFPAPGFGRDYYWLGLDKLTYITVE